MPANGGNLCELSNSEIPVRSDYEEECVPCNELACNGKWILENIFVLKRFTIHLKEITPLNCK